MCWDIPQIKQLIEEFNIQFCEECEDRIGAIGMTIGEVLGLGPEDSDYETRKGVVETFYRICEEARKNPVMTCYGRSPERAAQIINAGC